MDADSWAARFSASKRHQSGLQIRSGADLQLTFDDFDVEEDLRAEFPCPFCPEDFDIVGLCCHMDDEHSIEAKNARRRRYRKGSHYTLSMLTRELREGHLQSLFVGSSCPVVSSNTAADPLLSSFISSGPIVDVLAKPKSDSPAEETSDKQIIDEEEAEMGRQFYLTRNRRRGLVDAASYRSFCSQRFLRTRYEISSYKITPLYLRLKAFLLRASNTKLTISSPVTKGVVALACFNWRENPSSHVHGKECPGLIVLQTV